MSKSVLFEALEKIDSEVLNESVKAQIKKAFDQEVEKKVEELTESMTNAMDEYTNKIVESMVVDQKETFDKAVSGKVDELLEKATNKIESDAVKVYEQDKQELVEALDKYTEYVAEKFIEENKAAWEDEVKVTKAEAIMEATVNFANNFGVELDRITSTDDSKKELDEAVSELSKLKKENKALKKETFITEKTKDLSLTQRAKLSSLLESVDFEDERSFNEKLELFKSTLIENTEPKIETKNTTKTKKRSWE